MNALFKTLSSWNSQVLVDLGANFDATSNAAHVFVAESEVELRRAKKSVVNFISRILSWWAWLARASIVRSVAPGQRVLERHEFESIEIRRGGLGNVF